MPFDKDPQVVIDVSNDLSDVTDENGKVQFDVEYGDYVATITKDGYVTKTQDIAFRSNHKNFTVTLESEPIPTFDGYIAMLYDNESDENPFATTLIKATGLEENNRKEYSFFMGNFWIDDNVVVDGTTKNIMYESSNSDTPYGYVALDNNANVSDITVTLLDSDGEPYPQGLVAILELIQDGSLWDYGVTDENGEMVLNAPYGNWQLCYGTDQQTLQENYEDVTIDSATETFTVQLPMESNATVTVYGVQGADDVPIENATVTVTSDGGSQTVTVTGTTNSNGVAEFNLNDGQYLVNVTATGWKLDIQDSWDFSSEDPQMANHYVYLQEDV